MTMDRRQMLMALAGLAAGGCSLCGKRPETPARYLDVSGLHEPLPGEHFYITLFGSQRPVKTPRHCHTFAAFAHVRETADGPAFEGHSISWMPATLVTRPLDLHVEPGVNHPLCATFDWALADDQKVYQWGPYECRPRLYQRLLVQKAFLESGAVSYQCIDDIGEARRQGNACDCIHAITDIDPDYARNRYPLTRFGPSAASYIVRQLWDRDILINSEQTYEELNAQFGIDQYPIIHRTFARAGKAPSGIGRAADR